MTPSISHENNITYLISSFGHHFAAQLTRQFREKNIPLTAEQFSILVLLWQSDGMAQHEISMRIKRDKTTVTRVLVNLKKQQWVEQRTDNRDLRVKRVFLTARGKELQVKALPLAGNLYLKALQDISPKEVQAGIRLLQKMIHHINPL